MRRILTTLILCVAASGALAQSSPWDGDWGMSGIPECTTPDGLRSTCPALSVANGEVRSEEGLCAMSVVSVVPGFESASVVEFSCQGEGETWTFHGLMHLDLNGRLTMLNEHGSEVFLRIAGATGGAQAPVK